MQVHARGGDRMADRRESRSARRLRGSARERTKARIGAPTVATGRGMNANAAKDFLMQKTFCGVTVVIRFEGRRAVFASCDVLLMPVAPMPTTPTRLPARSTSTSSGKLRPTDSAATPSPIRSLRGSTLAPSPTIASAKITSPGNSVCSAIEVKWSSRIDFVAKPQTMLCSGAETNCQVAIGAVPVLNEDRHLADPLSLSM